LGKWSGGRGGDSCGEEGLSWRGISQGRNSQIVKIEQGTGGWGGKGVLVSNFTGVMFSMSQQRDSFA